MIRKRSKAKKKITEEIKITNYLEVRTKRYEAHSQEEKDKEPLP
jgi:hypothetical protein